MMAISRGLLYAGVQNIVTTLFEVNDKLTSDLMQLFYQNLLGGQRIKTALNDAKRTMAKKTVVPQKVWAAFTLIG